MARKVSRASTRRTTRSAMEVVGSGAAALADSFMHTLTFRVREETDLLMHRIEERTMRIRDRLLTSIYVSIILGVASVFLVVALLLYLVQSGVSWATSFLIGGALLLLGAGLLYMKRK